MIHLNNEVWKKLELELPAGEKITAKLLMPELSKRLYVGLDSLKQHHLLISLNDKDEEYNDSQSKGVYIITKNLVIKGNTSTGKYIDIVCQEPTGNDIFDIIGTEIASGLNKNIGPKEVIARVVSKWRNFWGKQYGEMLSHNAVIGLFAELWFLYYWLLPKINVSEVITRWRGPFSSRHDFEWTGKSVEVKATTNVESRIHKIHGLDQLSPPQNGELLLFSLRLREEQGATNTLPDLIAKCRDKLKDNVDALSKFENNLAMIGYSPLYEDEYSLYKFRVVDEKLFNVIEGFPRISTDSFINGIPSSIGMIEYSVNLDGYDNFCIAKSPNDNISFS